MADQPLAFDSTPNPAPYRGATAVWTTTGGNGNRIMWSAAGPNGETENLPVSVTPNPDDSTQATVTAGWEGMAVITAAQPGETPISRYVGVGAIYTYGAENLLGANSNQWTVQPDPPSYLPTFQAMQDRGAALAYTTENNTQNGAVLCWPALEAARSGFGETCYFTAATPTQGNETRVAPSCPLYVYAPDGTLWQVSSGDRDKAIITSTESNFPTRSDMDERRAALSWAAPNGLPPAPTPGASLTCYVLDVAQFPAASSSGTTYYTAARQCVAIQTATVNPPGSPKQSVTATFTFPGPVMSAVVGISHWSLTYAGKTDHQTKTVALNVGTLALNGNTVSAQVSATLYGEDTNLDPSSSAINLCCVAVLAWADPQIALATATSIPSGGQSSYVDTPYPSNISQAFVAGWSASYSAGHHIENFHTSASTAFHTAGGVAQTAITGTVLMEDKGKHSAENPTLNGGLIVAGTGEAGLVYVNTGRKQTTSRFSVGMPQPVSSVAPLIQELYISYGTNTDHDIRTIGGGTTGWTVSQDGMTVTFDDARAFMSDCSNNSQNNSSSYVNLVVFGIPR